MRQQSGSNNNSLKTTKMSKNNSNESLTKSQEVSSFERRFFLVYEKNANDFTQEDFDDLADEYDPYYQYIDDYKKWRAESDLFDKFFKVSKLKDEWDLIFLEKTKNLLND